VPVISPPLRDGAVLVSDRRIAAVGFWRSLRDLPHERTIDLGETLLLPGLVNAHCHLDYTDMAGQISPRKSFSDWIKGMLALKAHRTYSDYAASWLNGARMLLSHGTTTVFDIEAVPELLPEVLSATPLRVCSLIEMTGVRSRRPTTEIVTRAVEKIAALPPGLDWAGLSPHAPYSTSTDLLRLAAEIARQHGWLVAPHLAESAEEFEMYRHERGAMYEWLQGQRDMSDCGMGSPVQHAYQTGLLGPKALAIHVNYLDAGDADLLGRTGTHVVHCPRSHAYFGHASFNREELVKAGINICLGTDSLASVRVTRRQRVELDLFAEMRAMADADKRISPETLVRYVTVNAARALGKSELLGQISAGARADLIGLPAGPQIRDPYQCALEHNGPVTASMIDGRWSIEPHG